MKRILAVFLFFLFFPFNVYAFGCINYIDDDVPYSVKKHFSSFVTIYVLKNKKTLAGSGAIISEDGKIITAGHLFEGFDKKKDTILILRYDCSQYEGELLNYAYPDFIDSAIVKIKIKKKESFPPIKMGGTEDIVKLKKFSFVYLFSSPHGEPNTITRGVLISKYSFYKGLIGVMPYLKAIIPAQPGSSGGPLLNEEGTMIGMIIGCNQIRADFFEGDNFYFCTGASYFVPVNALRAYINIYSSSLVSNTNMAH